MIVRDVVGPTIAILAIIGAGAGVGIMAAVWQSAVFGTGAVAFSVAFPTSPALEEAGPLSWVATTHPATTPEMSVTYTVLARNYPSGSSADYQSLLDGYGCASLLALNPLPPRTPPPPIALGGPLRAQTCTQTLASGLTNVRAAGCDDPGGEGVVCYQSLMVGNGHVVWTVFVGAARAGTDQAAQAALGGAAAFISSFQPQA